MPAWCEGLVVAVLSAEYQRITAVLAAAEGALSCKELAAGLGVEPVAAKVEGCGRRRTVWCGEAGWSSSPRAGSRSAPVCEAAGHEHRQRPQDHRLTGVAPALEVAGQKP